MKTNRVVEAISPSGAKASVSFKYFEGTLSPKGWKLASGVAVDEIEISNFEVVFTPDEALEDENTTEDDNDLSDDDVSSAYTFLQED